MYVDCYLIRQKPNVVDAERGMDEGNQQVTRKLSKPSDSSTEWYTDGEPVFYKQPGASDSANGTCKVTQTP